MPRDLVVMMDHLHEFAVRTANWPKPFFHPARAFRVGILSCIAPRGGIALLLLQDSTLLALTATLDFKLSIIFLYPERSL